MSTRPNHCELSLSYWKSGFFDERKIFGSKMNPSLRILLCSVSFRHRKRSMTFRKGTIRVKNLFKLISMHWRSFYRVLFRSIKVTRASIPVTFINALLIVSIVRSAVFQVEPSTYLNVSRMITTGHSGISSTYRSLIVLFISIALDLLSFTGEKLKSINLGSYNYLGFANNTGPIADSVINAIKLHGVATASSPQEHGTCSLTDTQGCCCS